MKNFVKSGLIGICGIGLWLTAAGAAIPIKGIAGQILIEQAFEKSQMSHKAERPWPWADMTPIARLSVPRLKIERTVLDTGSRQAMAFGPTLVAGSVKPGEPGTAVIAAHRDTHFRFLQDIVMGDPIVLTGRDGAVHRYRVTRTQIVRWDQFMLDPNPQDHRLALSTCYPFGAAKSGPLRFVVHAVETVSHTPNSPDPLAS